jgi:hypothetical protein
VPEPLRRHSCALASAPGLSQSFIEAGYCGAVLIAAAALRVLPLISAASVL